MARIQFVNAHLLLRALAQFTQLAPVGIKTSAPFHRIRAFQSFNGIDSLNNLPTLATSAKGLGDESPPQTKLTKSSAGSTLRFMPAWILFVALTQC